MDPLKSPGALCGDWLRYMLDRVGFKLYYRAKYKKAFKYYGDNVRWGRDFARCRIPKSVRISCPENISIGDNCRIDEQVFLQCHKDGEGIAIGEGTRINANVHIQAFSRISIGSHVLIAPFVLIVSGNHGFSDKSIPIMHQEYVRSGAVSIGSGTWLGRCSHVLGGVSLGANCVVGASSVVTKSFRDGSVIAGVPAKTIPGRKGEC